MRRRVFNRATGVDSFVSGWGGRSCRYLICHSWSNVLSVFILVSILFSIAQPVSSGDAVRPVESPAFSQDRDSPPTPGNLEAQDMQDAVIGAPPGAPVQAVQPLGDPFASGIPLDWLGAAADNLRFTVDLAGRVQYNSGSEEWSTLQFYGFDLYKVFSGDQGDFATLVLQGFATRIDNVKPPPFFFDSPTDWEFIYRMFYLNVRLDPRGALNVKVGHFENPFGLEALLDTNGTLRQVGTMRNLGVKADWGVTLNGVTQDFEYEIGLGRGSGNQWHANGSPFQVSGRVGTIREANSWVGISGFAGDLWRPGGIQLQRRRIGIDGGFHSGPWSVMGQVSGGSNDGNAVVNGFAELDWHAPDDEWLLYGQLQAWTERDDGWNDNIIGVLGLEWAMDKHIVLSVQFIQNITVSGPGPRASLVQFQTRYRF